eukprot:scaffold16759_cov27-Phaeocystis_antarctica.AAC.1
MELVRRGASNQYLRLQPRLPTVAAPITYGCSLDHLRCGWAPRCSGACTTRARPPPRCSMRRSA